MNQQNNQQQMPGQYSGGYMDQRLNTLPPKLDDKNNFNL